jgi:hypothetical protein
MVQAAASVLAGFFKGGTSPKSTRNPPARTRILLSQSIPAGEVFKSPGWRLSNRWQWYGKAVSLPGPVPLEYIKKE